MKIKKMIVAELDRVFSAAEKLGLFAIEITAGSLEKRARLSRRTPAVCNAMRSVLGASDDEFRKDTVKKDSTTNVFHFKLPRRV